MVKLANPIYYPIAIFVGGVVLVVSIRVISLSNYIALPLAITITTLSASVLNSTQFNPQKSLKQQLQLELENAQSSSKYLAEKAEELRKDADVLLTQHSFQMESLIAIQETCDRAVEISAKIDPFLQHLTQSSHRLSLPKLQQQLREVQRRMKLSANIEHQQLEKLAETLQRHIHLAKQEKINKNVLLFTLSTTLQDSAGRLQQLSSKLQNSNLETLEELQDIHSFILNINRCQDNVEILLS